MEQTLRQKQPLVIPAPPAQHWADWQREASTHHVRHAQRAKAPDIDGSALPAGAQRPQPRSGPGAPTTPQANLSGNTNVREVSFIGREGKAELWEGESP